MTTLKNVGRLNKSERELFNSIVMIENMEDYLYFEFYKMILDKIQKLNEIFHKVRLFFVRKSKIAQIEKDTTKYKNILKKIIEKKDKLISKDYIIYKVRIYNTSKQA